MAPKNPHAPRNRASTPLAADASLADPNLTSRRFFTKGLRTALSARSRKKWLLSCAFEFGLLILSGPALAHHGNAAYDLANPVTLKGTVTEFVWSNPHVQIYFDVQDGKGKVAHWASETVSPGLLSRAGWTKTELRAGDEITITLGPAKNGSPVGYALKIVLANGEELILGQGRDVPYTH
jgi:Family of unknown function (DUF6152)